MIAVAKQRFVALLAAIFCVGVLSMTPLVDANAATIPNRFYCKPAGDGGGWCYQVNKPDPSVGHICHWKNSGMDNKPRERWCTTCTNWGHTVAQQTYGDRPNSSQLKSRRARVLVARYIDVSCHQPKQHIIDLY